MRRDRLLMRLSITPETQDLPAAVAAIGAAVQQAILAVTESKVIGNSTCSLQILDPRRKRWPREGAR